MEDLERQEDDDPAWAEYLEKRENDWERQAKLWARNEARENWLLCARVKEPDKKIKCTEKIHTHASRYSFKRIHLGAIMGVVINDNEKTFALENGFYLIEPSGEEFFITVPEGEYSPREW